MSRSALIGDLAVQWRRRRTLAAVAAAGLFPVVLTVALATAGSGHRVRVGDIPLLLVPGTTGLSVPLIALSSTMRFFLPLLIAVVAGEAVAGEAASGRLRYALARPAGRTRYLVSRALVAGSICAALAVVLPLAATLCGVAAFGWHPLTAINGDPISGGTVATFSAWDALSRTGVGALYVAAGMSSIFAFAFLLSTITSRAFVAVAGGAGISVLSRVLNADYLPGVRAAARYMPNNDIDLWQHLFSRPDATTGMGRFLILQAVYVAVFALGAWWIFRRRDVLT